MSIFFAAINRILYFCITMTVSIIIVNYNTLLQYAACSKTVSG